MATPELTASVGEHGVSKRHEVLIVQFMLKHSERKPFYGFIARSGDRGGGDVAATAGAAKALRASSAALRPCG